MHLLLCIIPLLFSAPIPQDLRSALAQERLYELKKMGPDGYKQLHQISTSENEPIDQRWKALLAMAKIGGKESLQELEKHLTSPTWYMRSAGLFGMSLVDAKKAQQKAKQLMKTDRALLVRAAALQVLSQDKKLDREFLWQELHNPLNFHNGKSLSLRASIVQLLAQRPVVQEKKRFAFLQREKDPLVQKISQETLLRL